MGLSFLVLGLARDCQRTLRQTVSAIHEFLPPDSLISMYLVESDSKDQTLETMKVLREEDTSFNFISLGNLAEAEPDRILRITQCRNSYLEHLDQVLVGGEHYDFVLVADFDGVNTSIRAAESIDRLLSQSTVICANQRGRYYDILALRKTGWVEEDYRVTNNLNATRGIDPLVSQLRSVFSKQIRISPSSDNIEVESAFGGLAIYPLKAISGLRYSAKLLAPGVYECEHVSINRQVRQRGYAIEIAPSLQNKGSLCHTFFSLPPLRFLALAAGSLRGLFRKFRGS